jgi:hypothetical protein
MILIFDTVSIPQFQPQIDGGWLICPGPRVASYFFLDFCVYYICMAIKVGFVKNLDICIEVGYVYKFV